MNYEQKYKEALERARDMISYKEVRREDMEYLFPELKESEDEKIRKQIISFLKEFEYDHYRSLDFSSWITWLEKQGEQKPTNIDFKAKDCYVSNVDGKIHIAGKFEPKFKTGQWIVWQDKCYKVNYNGCGYELVDQNGLSTSLEYGTIDENAHLWTIQDAKDGDVLVYGDDPNHQHVEVILIFKSFKDEMSAYTHFHIFNDVFRTEDWCDFGKKAHPATEEQRDRLFTKMKEAGYEWNADEKKLNKVIIYEQK